MNGMSKKKVERIHKIIAGALAAVQVFAFVLFCNVLQVNASTTYSADIISYEYNSSGALYKKYVYHYEGAFPLVVVNNYDYYSDYLVNGSYSYTLYTGYWDNAFKNFTVDNPTVTLVSTTVYNTGDGTVSSVTENNEEKELAGLSYACNYYNKYASDIVENVEGSVYYIHSRYHEISVVDGTAGTSFDASEAALAFLLAWDDGNDKPSDTVLAAYNIFNCKPDSRSLLVNNSSYHGNLSLSLLNATLEDNVFSFDGTAYGSVSPANGGVLVHFNYKSSYDLDYHYYLPLSGGAWELNLADYETCNIGGTTYTLRSLVFMPVIRMSDSSYFCNGTSIGFSYDTLVANGCFDKGGDPLVKTTHISDKNDNVGDPSVDSDETGNYIGGTFDPEDSETDTSNWTIFDWLKNIAVNLYNGDIGIAQAINELRDGLLGGIVGGFQEILTDITGVGEGNIIGLIFPGDGYIEEYLNEKVYTLREHFPFIDTSYELMENLMSMLENVYTEAPSFNLPFSQSAFGRYGVGDVTISFSWFEPYRDSLHGIVSGFMYAGFAYKQYFNIKNLISATNGVKFKL